MIDAVLITEPRVHFDRFLSITREALGVSLSAAADSSRKQLTESERFLSCLTEMNPNASLFHHVSFSVLVACDDRDLIRVMEIAPVAWVSRDTKVRGIVLAVGSATLSQWRDACVTGSRATGEVQALFNRLQTQFEMAGLNVWQDFKKKQTGHTFLLEHK